MRESLVLTLTGHDRVGIVEHVTKEILKCDGNVEASRMARLGGEFAMLMLVSAPAQKFEELTRRLQGLHDEGYTVTTQRTEQGDHVERAGWIPYQVDVTGADHEGIIHHITRRLASHRINIEAMDTGMVKASMSGAPLFTMTAIVLVPPELTYRTLQDDLERVADDLNVDIEVSPYTG